MSIIQISSVGENGFNPTIYNSNDLKSTNYLLDALFTKIMNENSRTSWDEIYGNDLMQDLFQGLRGNSNLGALATVPQGLRITVRPVFFVYSEIWIFNIILTAGAMSIYRKRSFITNSINN